MNISASLKIIQKRLSNYPTADSRNMSNMIADFADLSRQREIKIAALTHSLRFNSFTDDDGDRGEFSFTHRGERFRVSFIGQVTESGYNNDTGNWVDEDSVNIFIRRVGIPGPLNGSWIISSMYHGKDFEGMAKHLLELIDDSRFCLFCGQLFDYYPNVHLHPKLHRVVEKNPICMKCALNEMKTPCVCCKIQMGHAYNPDDEKLMHHMCKRRRKD